MPIISSIAAVSSRGYGQFMRPIAPPGPPPPGTTGVFYLANSTANTSRYQFASKTMTQGTTLKSTLGNTGTGAGNSNLMMGYANTPIGGQKYIWTSEVTEVGPNLVGTMNNGAATSNADQIIFNLGNSGRTTALYTYAADSVAAAALLLAADVDPSGAGNSTVGIFHRGQYATSSKYTYATGAWSAATNLHPTVAWQAGSAGGTGTFGIFVVGSSSDRNSYRYTYANDTTAASTAFLVASWSGASACNDVSGLFAMGALPAGGTRNTTAEYVWSNSVVATGTSLSSPGGRVIGSGNGTTGVNIAT